MDIISLNEAATANGRIEKFIENPDSNSGIVTVPKVIEAGESVTVPAGRVAVLPNVQVDGELVVDGEVFIPSGSGLSTVVQKSGDTMTGNLNFASGTKITGDFSNATESNRVLVQTSTPNSSTFFSAVPSGTGTVSALGSFSSSDVNNSSVGYLSTNASAVRLISALSGTGSYLPLSFYTSGVERMRIDAATGNVGIGTSSPTYKLDTLGQIKSGGIGQDGGYVFARSSDNVIAAAITLNSSTQILEYHNGLDSGVHSFRVNNTERFRIDSNGTALVTGSGGLGYGTGSGGTVTQLTSKSTSVTLNKPCGQITMNNAALAAGASVTFQLVNSSISVYDTLVCNLLGISYLSAYSITCVGTGNGYAYFSLKNNTGSNLSDAVQFGFSVVKGATA